MKISLHSPTPRATPARDLFLVRDSIRQLASDDQGVPDQATKDVRDPIEATRTIPACVPFVSSSRLNSFGGPIQQSSKVKRSRISPKRTVLFLGSKVNTWFVRDEMLVEKTVVVVVADELASKQPLTTAQRSQSSAIDLVSQGRQSFLLRISEERRYKQRTELMAVELY
ncbi:hypothetical protein DY000_02032338 [Brassica cretica]|uniref:Uncharacterized protein n=1 Tax=Brassica cretica TaxID=69181 RepID=A0ABQ7DEK9_BRACR|nr:hypothetical protein DY000_02032338 [Brassica cretica]